LTQKTHQKIAEFAEIEEKVKEHLEKEEQTKT